MDALAALATLCKIALQALSRARGRDAISVAPFVPTGLCLLLRAQQHWIETDDPAVKRRTGSKPTISIVSSRGGLTVLEMQHQEDDPTHFEHKHDSNHHSGPYTLE